MLIIDNSKANTWYFKGHGASSTPQYVENNGVEIISAKSVFAIQYVCVNMKSLNFPFNYIYSSTYIYTTVTCKLICTLLF